MTQKEMNAALFDKMNAEMKQFASWLLTRPPEEILNHSYEYATKFDIISDMEGIELSEERARALLQSDTPLEDVYRAYDHMDISIMDYITDCIESKADEVISLNRETASLTVYPYSGDYAYDHGELDQYRESNKLNVACKEAIQAAISRHYNGEHLDEEAVHLVVARFGAARTSFVLANTVQEKDWDGRFSQSNKGWARPIPILPDENTFGNNNRLRYVVNSHPGLIDTFISIFRKEYCQEKQIQKIKPSVRERLKSASQKNAPNVSAHSKRKEYGHGEP